MISIELVSEVDKNGIELCDLSFDIATNQIKLNSKLM